MGKGKLVFKGDAPKKKNNNKKKNKKSKRNNDELGASSGMTSTPFSPVSTNLTFSAGSPGKAATAAAAAAHPPATPTIEEGIGKITSSGTVLTGFGTNFTRTLNAGDAILVTVPAEGNKKMTEEMRIITMRLSDTSAAISTPFSSDIKLPINYKYVSKPRDVQKEIATKMRKEKLEKDEVERSAFGTYRSAGGNELVYREVTEHGSYRIRREKVAHGGAITRSDLLDMRSQKKSDKYC